MDFLLYILKMLLIAGLSLVVVVVLVKFIIGLERRKRELLFGVICFVLTLFLLVSILPWKDSNPGGVVGQFVHDWCRKVFGAVFSFLFPLLGCIWGIGFVWKGHKWAFHWSGFACGILFTLSYLVSVFFPKSGGVVFLGLVDTVKQYTGVAGLWSVFVLAFLLSFLLFLLFLWICPQVFLQEGF